MLKLGDVNGNPYVGVYCVASEHLALLPDVVEGKTAKDITIAAGSAVATASMEFTYDRAQSLTKSDILKGLMEIYKKIKSENALPLT